MKIIAEKTFLNLEIKRHLIKIFNFYVWLFLINLS